MLWCCAWETRLEPRVAEGALGVAIPVWGEDSGPSSRLNHLTSGGWAAMPTADGVAATPTASGEAHELTTKRGVPRGLRECADCGNVR